MRNLRKKVLSTVLSGVMVGAMAFTTIPVSAATVSTGEFGTMTYYLRGSGNTVTAHTSVTKTANKVITKLEIQVNATGATIFNYQKTASNAKACTNTKVTNYTVTKLAAWGTHEARGNSSIAKYTSATF